MIVSNTEVRVRYAETDKMGVVYHSNYFIWFEIGRVRLLEEIGFPYRQLEDSGFRLPVLEAEAKFHRPARFDDVVSIATTISEKPTLRITIQYDLTCRNHLLCSGLTRHAFINAEGQPVRPPRAFLDRMESFFQRKDSASLR